MAAWHEGLNIYLTGSRHTGRFELTALRGQQQPGGGSASAAAFAPGPAMAGTKGWRAPGTLALYFL
jgi:hypothetical protein